MKTISALMALVFSTLVGNAAAFKGFMGFGSVSNATSQYSIPLSSRLDVAVYQETLNGQVHASRATIVNLKKMTNITLEGLNALMRSEVMKIASGALTNTAINKDAPLLIDAVTSGGTINLAMRFLYCKTEFTLGKTGSGTYYVPSLDISMVPMDAMNYEIQGLEWARIEVTNSLGETVYVEDSRYDEPNYVNLESSYLSIPYPWATSGSKGEFRLKITIVVREGTTKHIFKIFGSEGTQVPETPIRTLGMKVNPDDGVRFDIDGGDTGRILMIQKASSLSGPWTDVSEEFQVPPGKYPPMFYGEEFEEGHAFFRVRTVEKCPFRNPSD